MTIKHPLRAFRDANGMTLGDLAEQIGVKPNTVWRWENGRVPERPMWARIEKVTGIKTDQIVRFVAEGAAA